MSLIRVKRVGSIFNQIVIGLMVLALSACVGDNSGSTGLSPGGQNSVEKVLTPNPQGEVIGSGNVRITLLVPTSIPGGASEVARELRNGAALAMQDFGKGNVQLVVKDTKGQAAEAQSAAAQAVSEGSSLIVGPLFASNVSAASGAAQPASVPMLAFSTDTTIARRGVYLFSFTPQSDTTRIIEFAASNRRRSILAMLPNSAEGNLRERVLREVAGRHGVLVTVAKYERSPEGIDKTIRESAALAQTADTIYLPEGGPVPGLIVAGLKRNGVDMTNKQVLGSGAWESIKATDKNLQGALYPGRDLSSFEGFAARYQGLYGKRPGAQGALAYDAITLAAEMARLNGPRNPYPLTALESNRGYRGISGAFRIRSSGITQRGLAIYQLNNGSRVVTEPAISSFSGS